MIASIEPTLPKLPNFKWLGIVGILVILTFLAFQKCSQEPVITIDPNIELKKTISLITKQRDSALKLSKKVDTIRLGYVVKWRGLKPKLDSIPCPEALADVIVLTDSIVTIDSTEISLLKEVIHSDSIIIAKQSEVIVSDSILINRLNKKARRLRRQRNLAAAIGLVGWGIAVIK